MQNLNHTAAPDSKKPCPYCGIPMDYGVIVGQRDTGILWLPLKTHSARIPHLFTLHGALKKRNGRMLATPTYVGEPPRLDAWICPKCNTGVFQQSK